MAHQLGSGGSKALSFGRTGGKNKMSFGDDDDDKGTAVGTHGSAHANLQPAAAHRDVKTVIRDDGTEFPQKLNNKVFVDGLPYIDPEEGPGIEDLLKQFVSEWRVGTAMHLAKKEGQGFGYLSFKSPHSVDVAVNVLNGRKFLGRALRVQVPKERKYGAHLNEGEAEQPELKPWVRGAGAQGGMATAGNTPYQRQALLSDLSNVSSPEIIREALKEYAPALEERVEQIKIMSNGRKAFVTMYAMDDVQGFVNFMNGFKLLGRRLGCEAAQPPGSLAFSTPRAARASGFDKKEDEAPADEEAQAAAAPAAAPAAKKHEATSHKIIAGANANKKFPMPDLLGGDDAAPAAPAAAAAAKAKPACGATHSGTGDKPSKYKYDDGGSSEIIIGNVTDDVSEQALRNHFNNCGRIKKVEILINPHTRQPMGLAKVEFAISAHARFAVENLNASRLGGATIRIDRPGSEETPFVMEGGIQPTTETDASGKTTTVYKEKKEEIDEEAYMKHYGVNNKEKFFAEAAAAAEEGGDDDDGDDGFETVPVSSSASQAKTKAKKEKRAATDKKARAQVKTQKEIDEEANAEGDDAEEGDAEDAPTKKKAKKEPAFSMEKTKGRQNEPKMNAKQKKRRQ
jgi:RNA recognition motif-containing protein